jgi:hypothetical protein
MKRITFAFALGAIATLLGATPLGSAAGRLVRSVPPFAQRAGYANRAGSAATAIRLDGHRASMTPGPGQIPVLDPHGKLPATVGAVGPAGAPGPQGPVGPQGPAGAQGTAGSARGWAWVSAAGTIVTSGGATSIVVHKVGTGSYCITLSPDPGTYAPILASIQGPDATPGLINSNTGYGSVCNPYGGDGVFTMSTTGAPADHDFVVALP